MSNLSTQDIKELQGFLDDELLQFILDNYMPTTNCVSSTTLPEFMENELDELLTQLLNNTRMNVTVVEVLLQLQSNRLKLQQEILLNPSPVKKSMKSYRRHSKENTGR